MIYQIIFAGDEGWGYIFEGTSAVDVYEKAYACYATLLNNNDPDSSGSFTDEDIAHSLTEFAIKRPDSVPIECRYFPRILYRTLDTYSLKETRTEEWD